MPTKRAEIDRIPIAYRTYQCSNPRCLMGDWSDGTPKFVGLDHFDDRGECKFQGQGGRPKHNRKTNAEQQS